MPPTRVQVTWRKPGGVRPPGVVYCGRPSRWGNPTSVGTAMTAEQAVENFRWYAAARLNREPDWLDPLRDATGLACWCKSGPCHVDILISLIQSSETHEI